MTETRHVVLVTYGEPPTPAFMDQLVYSWRILVGLTRTVAPIPRPVLPVIALSRARGRRASWREHDYLSPLEPVTERQAQQMRETLVAADPAVDWQVHVAGALDAETLAELSAAHVLSETPADEWRGPDVALVLAAHGTVLNPPRPIDTGLVATETLRLAIAARLAPHFGTVVNGWLNHTRGGEWTDPPIEEALAHLVEGGFSRVVYYPYGFLADNAESELEGRVALQGLSGVESLHLPCLNESAALVDALARQIRESHQTSSAPAA